MNITKPTLMVIKGKHIDNHYLVNSNEDVFNVLREFAQLRIDDQWYEHNISHVQTDMFTDTRTQLETITDILKKDRTPQAGAELFQFMLERCRRGYEYEGWDFINFDEITQK